MRRGWVVVSLLIFCFGPPAVRSDTLTVPAGQAQERTAGGPWEDRGWSLATSGRVGTCVRFPAGERHCFGISAAGTTDGSRWPHMQVTVCMLRQGAIENVFDEQVMVKNEQVHDFSFESALPAGEAFVFVTLLTDMQPDGSEQGPMLLLKSFSFDDAAALAEPPSWWLPYGKQCLKLREQTSDDIIRFRMAKVTIETQPGAEVEILQQRHAFQFGTALSSSMFRSSTDRFERQRYLAKVTDNFNAAMHASALMWPVNEPTRGECDYETADRIIRWCHDHNIPMRGHCIFQGADSNVPDWAKESGDEALRAAVKQRATLVTSYYRGSIDEFDVSDQMLRGSYLQDRLGPSIRGDMFRWAKNGNSNALLFLNDTGILADYGLAANAYLHQISDFQQQGVPLGGIGCQGHFGSDVDPNHVKRTLDQLARFGLPIKITEYGYESPDGAARARHLEQFFRVCFAHPNVEAIYLRGFWEGADCRSNAALWNQDWSPTPAAEAYRRLVFREWWTDFHGTADSEGMCRVLVFHGTHQVRINGHAAQLLQVPQGTHAKRFRIRSR